MDKYKVRVEEVIVYEFEIECDNYNDVEDKSIYRVVDGKVKSNQHYYECVDIKEID